MSWKLMVGIPSNLTPFRPWDLAASTDCFKYSVKNSQMFWVQQFNSPFWERNGIWKKSLLYSLHLPERHLSEARSPGPASKAPPFPGEPTGNTKQSPNQHKLSLNLIEGQKSTLFWKTFHSEAIWEQENRLQLVLWHAQSEPHACRWFSPRSRL